MLIIKLNIQIQDPCHRQNQITTLESYHTYTRLDQQDSITKTNHKQLELQQHARIKGSITLF
jgi:hypothetical protein